MSDASTTSVPAELWHGELAALLEQQRRMSEELAALLDVNRAVGRHLEQARARAALRGRLGRASGLRSGARLR